MVQWFNRSMVQLYNTVGIPYIKLMQSYKKGNDVFYNELVLVYFCMQ